MDIRWFAVISFMSAGPLIGINRHGRILPGMSSHQAEIRTFQGEK